jgi:Divergent InlB B-repeat domain
MVRTRRRLIVAALAVCAIIAGPPGAANARQAEYTLRVFVNGNGSVKGSGIDCGAKGTTCGVSYALGTTITIQAEPSPSSTFAGWAGACTGVGTTCTFTAGEPTTVTAWFNYIEVVDVNNCGYTCSAPYTGNTKVMLTARAAPGSVFVGWNGYCKGETSSMGSSVARPASGRMITVRFQVSKPASVRLRIWSWKKRLISQARISVRAGPVTVRLPFSAGYKAGQYDLWAYVTGAGEKKYKLLHWTVQEP